jgi:hypothetical protein
MLNDSEVYEDVDNKIEDVEMINNAIYSAVKA